MVTNRMNEPDPHEIYEDIDIGDEQVTSNECWASEEIEEAPVRVYDDLHLGPEQVTSNECYDVEEN